jgi:hypothetical protein
MWVFEEGAGMLGAREEWRNFTRTEPADETTVVAPTLFVLDGETFDAGEAQRFLAPHCKKQAKNTSKLRRGDDALVGDWWLFIWAAACKEVSQRFGPERRCCKRRGVEVCFTMELLYRKLFTARIREEYPYPKSSEREVELLTLWEDLEFFERKKNRQMPADELGRFCNQTRIEHGQRRIGSFDQKTLRSFWQHAVMAWRDGWPFGGVSGAGVAART